MNGSGSRSFLKTGGSAWAEPVVTGMRTGSSVRLGRRQRCQGCTVNVFSNRVSGMGMLEVSAVMLRMGIRSKVSYLGNNKVSCARSIMWVP